MSGISSVCNNPEPAAKRRGHSLDDVPVTRPTPTHCPYCALQCGMHVAGGDGASVAVTARDFPTNRGGLCQKGWTAGELLTSPERLTTPLVRRTRNGPLEPATWDAALARVADAITRIQELHGRDAVAVFGG